MKNLMNQEAGFTLLELIVVVAVIGILAAIIVPQVSDIQGDAQLSSVKSSLSSVQTALERYKLDTDQGDGSYPAAQGDAETELGIDLTGYSYDSDGSGYIVAYNNSGSTDKTVSDGNGNSTDVGTNDTLEEDGNDYYYYITSEKTSVLTTN
ncbi:MAG: type II secretion system protein [Bacillota bacterium]